MMAVTTTQARRVLGLSRQLRELGDQPREMGSEHAAAQSSMAATGYELAGVFLAALDGAEDSLSDKLAAAKSLAQEVLDAYPAGTEGFVWLGDAIALLGRVEGELETKEG